MARTVITIGGGGTLVAVLGVFFFLIWVTLPLLISNPTAGDNDLGLHCLIFGTIQATFYAMLFGAPLALLAAVCTSELLTPRARTLIKPIIELMACLPSVVLGFLAAVIFAPFVRELFPNAAPGNALVVGLAMGFAVIPIIYTLAEDALSAVPGHLRAASLAAGATPWQTAARIVIPTALSGLLSALMVGLGRAVGETMIVLMAAGNTPIFEWNIFKGLRTLSAHIAIELPGAGQGSAQYRVLFLTALALFILTLLVNTTAEMLRLRFRDRVSLL